MNVDEERLTCPICFLLPENEVYQCRNGHILCAGCIAELKLISCPQCNVSIQGDHMSRNRFMEELIQEVKVACPFSERGCLEEVKRMDLPTHRTSCKFGKTFSICELLAFRDCNFTVNLGNLHELIPHLETAHGKSTLKRKFDKNLLTLQGFFDTEQQQRCFSHPIKFNEPFPYYKILFVCQIKDDFVSWFCFDLDTHREKAIVGSKTVKISAVETPTISWELPLLPIMDAKQFFRDGIGWDGPIRIKVSFLEGLRKKGTAAATVAAAAAERRNDYDYNLKFQLQSVPTREAAVWVQQTDAIMFIIIIIISFVSSLLVSILYGKVYEEVVPVNV